MKPAPKPENIMWENIEVKHPVFTKPYFA